MSRRIWTDCPRAVLSCVRCRRLKSKCDRQLPACSRCVTAGAVCMGFNSVHDTQVPRSLVQHLEQEIAQLEVELASVGYNDAYIEAHVTPDLNTASPEPANNNSHSATTPSGVLVSSSSTSLSNVIEENILASAELTSMINATVPVGSSLTGVVRRVQMGLTPSLVLSSTTKNVQNKPEIRTNLNKGEVDVSILASLPSHVIYALMKKYVQRGLPVHPFLYEPTVWEQLDRVLRRIPQKKTASESIIPPYSPTVMPDYDFLVIYLILAVSATLGSAEVGHAARCLAFSESLFREGIRHLSNPAPPPSDVGWIQITLLLLQYASINPKLGNVWILGGVVMRDCLELGFHRDVSGSISLDPLTTDLRRRIFWAAYCMDRSICAALRRPLSIPDAAIDAQVMSILPDRCITTLGLESYGQPQPTKGLALHWIGYRQLQSHMVEVHFQCKPLEYGQSWEEWLAITEQRIWQWYNSELPHDGWTDFVLFHGLVMLHRPSRRMPLPSSTSLLAAFEAAAASARSIQRQIVSPYFPRPWLAAHHMFATSLVVLFCLRHDYDNIAQKYGPQEIFEMTKLFTSNLLAICMQGWSEISEYAGIYERLLAPLLQCILSRANPISSSYTQEQDAELHRLLYPNAGHPKAIWFANSIDPSQGDLSPFDITIFDNDNDLLDDDRGGMYMLF